MNMATNGLDLAKYVLCGWAGQDGAAHAGGVYGLGCVFCCSTRLGGMYVRARISGR